MTADPPADAPTPAQPPSLKPRPVLLRVLWVIFLLWVGALLAMYFLTVYPHRHGAVTPSIIEKNQN